MLPPAMCISNSLTLGFPFGYMATKMVTRVGVALRGTEACNRVVGRESYAREREREREREKQSERLCTSYDTRARTSKSYYSRAMDDFLPISLGRNHGQCSARTER
jgi:hypothetical protein